MIKISKLHATPHVNADLLQLYGDIRNDIVLEQKEQDPGAQVLCFVNDIDGCLSA